ncbi:MAG: alpha amylase C-terminal domain-containing protein [Phycisphaerae bacterium]|nr:alpha amylase C-terminal domain-containing protein [Phycisphaerae bacterium]
MGAMPHAEGTTFRVWAPHAHKVFVTGTFNDWAGDTLPLAQEGHGLWSGHVAAARAGDQYKYRIVSQAREWIRMDPYARECVCSTCSSVVHDPAFDWGETAFQRVRTEDLVIYEMHIGTFNHKSGDKPGNFTTAIERLAYLRDLGINAVEVMPAAEFKGDYSWGYNPSLLFSIESAYGGPRAFKDFIKAAHALGIAVILDVVYNHLGPDDLDLWQFDGWQENGKGGIYFYNDHRSTTPWGETRPDYGRTEVRNYLRDNALMWLEEYRIDGLRWDATAFVRNIQGLNDDPAHDIPEGWSLMQWINGQVKVRFPLALCLAEDIRYNPAITRPQAQGGAGFDAQWNATFVRKIRKTLASPTDDGVNLADVIEAITYQYNGDPFERVIYTESHDEVANGKLRVAQELSPKDPGSWVAKKLSTLGAALVMTSPGIPMLFQGQEFLEDEWFHDRDPIDWSRQDTYAGIVTLYRDLIRCRRNLDGTTAGLRGAHVSVTHVNHADKILAFHRWDKSGPCDSTVIIVNLKRQEKLDYALGFPTAGPWVVRFNSDSTRYDAHYTNQGVTQVMVQDTPLDNQPGSGTVHLGPYSVLILSQNPA